MTAVVAATILTHLIGLEAKLWGAAGSNSDAPRGRKESNKVAHQHPKPVASTASLGAVRLVRSYKYTNMPNKPIMASIPLLIDVSVYLPMYKFKICLFVYLVYVFGSSFEVSSLPTSSR